MSELKHNQAATSTASTVTSASKASRAKARGKKIVAASRTTGRWFMFCVAVLLIFIAILLLIVRIGLPWLSAYKGELETRLTEQMRSPVVIDDLSVRWEQFGPKLSAQGVFLGDPGEQQVSLDEVLIDMNVWKSVTQRTPAFDELTLVGAKLDMQINDDGKLQLQGLKQGQQGESTSGSSSANNADVLSWLMNTKRVGLQDSSITLTHPDDQTDLTISNLNILATNDNDLHQLRVDMQLPEALGGKIEMGVDLSGNSDDIRNASADVHLKASDLKVDAWRSLQSQRFKGLRISTTGIARLDSTIQLELWGKVEKGSLQTARGQLLATDLIDLSKQEPVLDKIATDVAFQNTPSGWRLSTDSLEFTNGADTTAVQDVVYEFKPSDDTAWKLDARGETLELEVATRLVLSLFDEAADLPRARWLAEANPKGDLYDWDASFGLVNGKPDFSLFSIFHQLELTTADGAPGVSKIGGTIDMANNIGKITMQGIDMQLDLPALYAQPLPLQKLYGEFDLDVQDPLRTSLKGDVVIEDGGFNSSTRFEVKLEPGSSPHIYSQGKFSLDDLADTTRYMPVRLFRGKTTDWFKQALLSGKAVNGEVLMFGHAADFPFENNEGVFKMGLDYQDANVNYLVGWPHVIGAQGRLEMEGPKLRMTATDGSIDSMRLSNMDLTIDNLQNPVMNVSSTSAGPLPGMIDFANNGPLKETLGPAFSDISGTGKVQMDLNLRVPLRSKRVVTTVADAQAQAVEADSLSRFKVSGSVFLRNNNLSFGAAKVDLTDVDGAVAFTDSTVRVDNLQALLYGRPVRVNTKTEGKGSNRVMEVTMAGPMFAASVLENYDIPLTQFVEGQSQWNVSMRLPMSAAGLASDGIVIAAVSDLVGTTLKMPAPLGKSVGSASRMALSSRIDPNSDKQEWVIDYGDNVLRSLVRINDKGMQSFSGKFGGGAANDQVYDGIRLQGTVDSLSLDGWVEGIADFLDGLAPTESQTPIMPISADIKAKRFIVGRQSVGGGQMRFNTDKDYINGIIESPWLSASTRYPRIHWTKDIPALVRVAQVDKRFFDAFDSVPEDETVESEELDPRLLPPVHMHVSKLRWDALDLQDLTIRMSPSVSGVNIDTFGFAYQSGQLIGDGFWRLRDPQGVNPTLADQHVSRLNLTLQGDNFGDLLTDVGFEGTLAEGEGVISGSLQWSGPGYKPALEDLVGEMDVDMQRGRVLKIEPGAARIAGLFALQTIPRRLSLDFKDLVLDGLDYESIRGSVQLANNIAHTPLMQLNGAVGVIDVVGESNIDTQEFDQRITVLPRVSAALPIIGIISGGATAGVGALFAGGLLKAVGLDFDRIGLREYTLKGSWEDPALTRVPFKFGSGTAGSGPAEVQ